MATARYSRFKQAIEEFRWKARDFHPLSHVPWSAIRRIGQSQLLALTIIVPFLGSLLLFNKHVVDVLTLSPELIRRIFPNSTIDVNVAAQHLTLNRLYFVYFGLSLLGIASALFALLCPLEIKFHPTARSYLEAEGPLVTRARMGIVFPNVTNSFVYWFEDYPEGWSVTRQLGEPEDFHSMFSQVITEIYIAIPEDEGDDTPSGALVEGEPSGVVEGEPSRADDVGGVDADGPPNPSADDEDAQYEGGWDDFTDHRGRPDPYKIANSVHHGSTAMQAFAWQLQELATKDPFKNDVLTLQYMALDHSRLWFRLIVITFYALGFTLLLIPTTTTFVRLAVNAIH